MSERELLPSQMFSTTPKTCRHARVVLEVIIVGLIHDPLKIIVKFLLPKFELRFQELQGVILLVFHPFEDVMYSPVSI